MSKGGKPRRFEIDPETGEVVEKPGSGRPRKHPPKPAPAPRIPGEEYRDRTGRINRGAFGGDRAMNPKQAQELRTKSALDGKEFGEYCKGFAVEAFGIVVDVMTRDDTPAREKLAAGKIILQYAYGNPKTMVEGTIEVRSATITDALKNAAAKRLAREQATPIIIDATPIPTEEQVREMAELASRAAFDAITHAAIENDREDDDSED